MLKNSANSRFLGYEWNIWQTQITQSGNRAYRKQQAHCCKGFETRAKFAVNLSLFSVVKKQDTFSGSGSQRRQATASPALRPKRPPL